MIRQLTRLESMEDTGLVHSQINCIFCPLLFLASASILVNPRILFQLLRLLIGLISEMLATASACLLLLYGRHLGRAIPIIWHVISSLVPVIRAIELP
jgi:hypothetical protein